MWIEIIIVWGGFFLSFWRLKNSFFSDSAVVDAVDSPWPAVSIILPARNEAENLPRVLSSLNALDYPNFEIIVVNDGSSDATAQVAKSYGVTLVQGQLTPAGWAGKNWACYQGAKVAKGSALLFTDADTKHHSASLKKAVHFMRRNNANLISCVPYHVTETLWERLLGPFHVLILIVSRAFMKQGPAKQQFAIGQYLLFDAKYYYRHCSHKDVRRHLGEDLAFAAKTTGHGYRYAVYKNCDLFSVRMYKSLSEFFQGWSRQLRVAHSEFSPVIFFEMVILFGALIPFMSPNIGYLWPATVAILGIFAVVQQRIGKFHIAGVVLFPLSLLILVLISMWTLLAMVRKTPIGWKNRMYSRGKLVD